MNDSENISSCHNCGTTLQGKFCYQCGQKDVPLRLSTGELLKQFLGDYFSFDSKFFRSIIPLLIKPGYLTLRYFEGKRAQFIPALRMYIFISFLYFICLPNDLSLHFTTENGQNFGIALFADENRQEVIWSDSMNIFQQIELIQLMTDSGVNVSGLDTIQLESGEDFKNSIAIQEDDDILSRLIKKRLKNADTMSAALFMKTLNNNFGSALPKTLFVMIPLVALLLLLLYIRHPQFYYTDHLVFVLHLHSFYFVLLFIIAGLSMLNLTSLEGIILVGGGFVYLIVALRKVYQQKYWKTFLKTTILGVSYIVLFILGIVINLMAAFYFL